MQACPNARGNRKGTGCGKRIAPTSAGWFGAAGRLSPGRLRRLPAVLHPVALAGDRHDVCVVNEPVECGVGENRVDEHLGPLLERFVGRDDHRAALVPFRYDAKEMISNDAIERREAEFIEDDKIGTNVLIHESLYGHVGQRGVKLRSQMLDRREDDAVAA